MLSALVLAAGSSRRMGGDNKLLLPFKDGTILSHTIENILAAGIAEVIVITGHEAAQVEAAIRHLPVHIVHNPRHEEGMTGSIRQGVNGAKGDGYMICLSDMPLITPEEYQMLGQAFNSQRLLDPQCICVPVYQGKKGNPVIFSSFYKKTISQHPETEGCKEIVRSNAGHVLAIEMPSNHVLKDIDHPGDYAGLAEQP